MTKGDPLLSRVRHVVLDLDGTVYKDATLLPDVKPFLAALRDRGVGFTFVTNNTSRAVRDYVEKLGEMGVAVTAENICTPVAATVAWLEARGLRRVYVLGTRALQAEFAAAGLDVVENAACEAVVVGFDSELTYPRLCRTAFLVQRGLPFVATHKDRICPTEEATVLVDCGSICAALAAATGRQPDAVLGKPDPAMLHEIAGRVGVDVAVMAVIGDRLYTDIAMANRAGALSVLVLTGEASAQDVAAAAALERPRIVCENLGELMERW